jgi:hypothetical protein
MDKFQGVGFLLLCLLEKEFCQKGKFLGMKVTGDTQILQAGAKLTPDLFVNRFCQFRADQHVDSFGVILMIINPLFRKSTGIKPIPCLCEIKSIAKIV